MEIKKYEIIVSGNAEGEAFVSPKPISFWGGIDPANGVIEDIHNSECGKCITGKIFCLPRDKGSCTGSAVLLEMIRAKTNPAAILCVEAEPVMSVGPIISNKIYNINVPIRLITQTELDQIKSGDHVYLTDDSILIES